MLLGQSDLQGYPELHQQCLGLVPEDNVLIVDAGSLPLTDDCLAQIEAAEGPVLLVDLLAFCEYDGAPVEAAITMTQRRCGVAQQLIPHQASLQWLAAVPASGWASAGAAQGQRAALMAGATAGAVKSIGQEWERWHRVAYVDLAAAPAHWLQEECQDSAEMPEVLYLDGARWLPDLQIQTAPAPTPRALPERPALLITGGGIGITATVASALAAQIGPFRALILGRTTPAKPDEMAALESPKLARQVARQQLGSEASARQVQEAAQKELRRVALSRSLALLEASGIEVMYIPTDVQDAEAVGSAVKTATAVWGAFDAVIHGAGVDKSRDLLHKSATEIDLIMGVKLRGLQHIIDALEAHSDPTKVKCWLGFGSVSARFGNRGQFDYAAANEALARWLCSFSEGLIVDYTAWDEVGMAASLAGIMKERGVDMLPPQMAATRTAALLTAGHIGEWVMSGRLPAIRQDDPLLGTPDLYVPGAALISSRTLHTDQCQYLRDHQIQGAEIMPGVVSFLGMRRAATQVGWQASLDHSTDVQFPKAIKLWAGHPLEWTIEAERLDELGGPSIATSIRSMRKRKGQEERAHHAAAIFHPGKLPTSPSLLSLLFSQSNESQQFGPEEVYKTFFHGPCWQVVARAEINEDCGLAVSPKLEEAGHLGRDLAEEMRWDAVGLELLLQGAGLWVMHIPGRFALPFGIERWLYRGSPKLGSVVTAHLKPTGQRGDLYLFDGALVDQEKQLLQQVTGLQMRIFPL